MSVSTLAVIMDRIATATPSSRIAVFDIGSTEKADAVFADTVESQKALMLRSSSVIGVYDGTMSKEFVRGEIQGRLNLNAK